MNTPTPENPLCIGAASPRLLQRHNKYTFPHAIRTQKALNDIAAHLEGMPLSAESRHFINLALHVCHDAIYSVDDSLIFADKTIKQLTDDVAALEAAAEHTTPTN